MEEVQKIIQECLEHTDGTSISLWGLGLTELPDNLPDTLTFLDCSHNQIQSLDNLPDTLEILKCSDNKLLKLPDKLPKSLFLLDCSGNQIEVLPENLPDSLETLCLYHTKVTKLPKNIPRSLEQIYIDHNNMEELPPKLKFRRCNIFWDSGEILYQKGAKNIISRAIKKRKWKKRYKNWIICKRLCRHVDRDSSKIVTQYL
ncbi:MAG: hypothetical protein Dasosvirus2_10 [Dasosvirus sp.]|uniref:Leucine-rich repeat protein n=1 Tax=Dasosvirus sp. TaxID=2487764 RepID=A0A3G4ZSX3_9VIRU|nr:MAG: hypothetical protein Dasosvirus2_10 [Dasosvirus sp.]